jgi:hypothetical protein
MQSSLSRTGKIALAAQSRVLSDEHLGNARQPGVTPPLDVQSLAFRLRGALGLGQQILRNLKRARH